MVNVIEQNAKTIEIAREREFRNYCIFFWNRKNKEKSLKQKKKASSDKLEEKKRILQELEENNEKRKNILMKKMMTMDAKRELYEKIKREKIMDMRKAREQRNRSCEARRKNLRQAESEKREEILNVQTMLLSRSLSRDSKGENKKNKGGEHTINIQMIIEKNLLAFNKQMNVLKSNSILKLSQEEKMKIFRDFKRKEAEKKRKEEEEAALK